MASFAQWDLAPWLREALQDGFGDSNSAEDQFDAMVGLAAMLHVIEGRHVEGAPPDADVRSVEGWIFGRPASSPAATRPTEDLIGNLRHGFEQVLDTLERITDIGIRLTRALDGTDTITAQERAEYEERLRAVRAETERLRKLLGR